MRRDHAGRQLLIGGIFAALVLAGIAIAPAPLGAEEAGLTVHAELANQNACISRTEIPDGSPFLDPSELSMPVSIATDVSAPPHGGQEIALTNTTVTVSFGNEILQSGVDVGLLSDGMRLPAVLEISVDGVNTTETTQSTTATQKPTLKVLQGVAQPLVITFALPESAWTPVDSAQTVTFREKSLSVAILLPVLFDPGLTMIAECEPTGTATLFVAPGSGKPSAPANVEVFESDGAVEVSWTPPAVGSAITKYHVSVVDGAGNPPIGITGATTRTVPGGQTGMTFTGLINGLDYRFRVAAENAFGVGAFSTASHSVAPLPLISIGDASTFEGNAGNRALRFTVSLSAKSLRDVAAFYWTGDGTAKAGSDYTAESGVIVIPSGKASVEVTISVRGDLASEATESFHVSLTPGPGARTGRFSGLGKILNDDPGPQARRVHIGDAGVVEGRTGTRSVRLTVSLSAASSRATTVKYATTNLTASNATDYTKASGTVTIPAGYGSVIVAVAVRGDTSKELNETFRVTLSQATGASLGRSSAIATIHNDD